METKKSTRNSKKIERIQAQGKAEYLERIKKVNKMREEVKRDSQISDDEISEKFTT